MRKNWKGFNRTFQLKSRKPYKKLVFVGFWEVLRDLKTHSFSAPLVVLDVPATKLCFALQIPYIETSAKDPPLNVDKAFHDLVRVIR